MKIYRIENCTGRGVFHGIGMEVYEVFRKSGLSKEYQHKFHPSPREDTLLEEGLCSLEDRDMYDYHFGFSSIEQLLTWFPNERTREKIRGLGFFVSVYESDDFIKGNSQACFIMESARIEKTLNLVSLEVDY